MTSTQYTPAPEIQLEEHFGKMYKVYNGAGRLYRTFFHRDSPDSVIRVLMNALRFDTRIEIEYGYTETHEKVAADPSLLGKSWGDKPTGYVGKSMGDIKIPLVIYNKRSRGGPGMLEDCIVRIRTSRGKVVLYQHPNYQPADE
jgi:hypothetical protein